MYCFVPFVPPNTPACMRGRLREAPSSGARPEPVELSSAKHSCCSSCPPPPRQQKSFSGFTEVSIFPQCPLTAETTVRLQRGFFFPPVPIRNHLICHLQSTVVTQNGRPPNRTTRLCSPENFSCRARADIGFRVVPYIICACVCVCVRCLCMGARVCIYACHSTRTRPGRFNKRGQGKGCLSEWTTAVGFRGGHHKSQLLFSEGKQNAHTHTFCAPTGWQRVVPLCFKLFPWMCPPSARDST